LQPGRNDVIVDARFKKRSRLDVQVPGHGLDVFFSFMLRLVRGYPMTEADQNDIVFESVDQPAMTADLAAALAQLVRSALARRAERPERAA
jgi:hypothetical protein